MTGNVHEDCVLVANRDRQIAGLMDANREYERAATAYEGARASRERVMGRQTKRIEELEGDVKELEGLTDAQERCKERRDATIEVLKTAKKDLFDESVRRAHTIQEHYNTIKNRDKEIAALQHTIGVHQQAAAGGIAPHLHSLINERDERIKLLEDEVKLLTATVTKQTVQNEVLNDLAEISEEQIDKLHKRIEVLKNRMFSAMYGGTVRQRLSPMVLLQRLDDAQKAYWDEVRGIMEKGDPDASSS